MAERDIVRGKKFMYTEDSVRKGIIGARKNLDGFRVMSNNPDENVRRTGLAGYKSYEATLNYVDQRSPKQMLVELKGLWENISSLEEQKVPDEKIEDMLLRDYGDVIYYYRNIFNKGWIESAMQALTTARMREYNNKTM